MGLFTAVGYFHAIDTTNGTALAILDAETIAYVVLGDGIIKTCPYIFYFITEEEC